MFSLIISVISIALLASISIVIIYFGSESINHQQKSQQVEHTGLEQLETPSIPKRNIETSTIVEKTEINNYDFTKLSDSLNYIVVCVVAFFLIKYSFKLLRSIFKKINIIREERKTLRLIKEFNNKITNDSMIVSYADAIEGQSMINNILLENNDSIRLKALNQELMNKREIVSQIINKNYNFN